MDLLSELAKPFERMTAAEASALLEQNWGIEATGLTLLDTERDDTYRVDTAHGRYVLKVAHPDDDPLYVNLQTAAMSYAAEDPSLPVQSLVLSVEGEVEPTVSHAGRERIARVLTWLDGATIEPGQTFAQFTILGATLARLGEALSTFDHPAAHRTFAWDLQSLEVIRAHEHPAVADIVFDEFAALDLAALPHQVIHQDFHPGNVLVDPRDSRYVVGILDFGDTVYSARVADLGVAIAYHLPAEGNPRPVLDAFLQGYESVTPLSDAERDAVPTLIAARLVQRIVLPGIVSNYPYADSVIAHTTRILDNFLKER